MARAMRLAPRVPIPMRCPMISSRKWAQAITPAGPLDVLHGLKPKRIFAIGESQSASRLATYANAIQPLANVYDGFLLLSAVGRKIRGDLSVPVFKLSTEYDVASGDASVRQPDAGKFRAWEVAGTSHVDQHLRASREPLELRDNGNSLEAAMAPQCEVPEIGTRVPTRYVVASALDKLIVWSEGGHPPRPRRRWRWRRSIPGRRCPRSRVMAMAWRRAASGWPKSRSHPGQ